MAKKVKFEDLNKYEKARIIPKKRDVVSEYREAAAKDILPPEPDEPLSHVEVLARIDAPRKKSLVGRVKGFLRLG